MKRWHQEYGVMKKQLKLYKKYHMNGKCVGQKGRFRKKKSMDCGNPKCQMCHSNKFPKRLKTRKEIKSEIDYNDWCNMDII